MSGRVQDVYRVLQKSGNRFQLQLKPDLSL
jgi:hypothetical protein